MTEQEMEMVKEWQASPEGMVYDAVWDMQIGMQSLEIMLNNRAGVQYLKKEMPNLLALEIRLFNLFEKLLNLIEKLPKGLPQ